ncbi:MAG: tetratricopeptide repeat protein [Treponema sp.]|nr:tetratricopeptide repeat protein [Candidatus Treponema caballi]
MLVKQTDSNTVVRRRGPVVRKIIISTLIFIAIVLILSFGVKHIVSRVNAAPSLSKVYDAWDKQDYINVYNLSNDVTAIKPYEGTALAYHGYASFYLGVSSTDTSEAQSYINEAINSLRLASYSAPDKLKPQIYYMLGKAYFHKDSSSAYYYYADLTVYYLNKALEGGFSAADIPEYLGLSYAQLSMTEQSIASFSEALGHGESDMLLLAIAEQYIKSNQQDKALQYLYRLRAFSDDEQYQIKAGLLLGNIYTDDGKYEEAMTEFQTILEKNPENADAYYGIGIIYEMMGDMAKARAEWRNALKKQVNHPGALQKLGQ